MKTNKVTKNENNAKKEKTMKSDNKTRAEIRQAILMDKTLKEAERVENDASDLFDKLYSLDSKELTPIDRHLMTLQLHAMESYASTLRMVYAFESVRTRRRGGEFLRKNREDLLRFIYGAYASYETGCSCKKDCCKKNEDKKSEKTKSSRPAKVVSAAVVPAKAKASKSKCKKADK